jgi:hypothetical protein
VRTGAAMTMVLTILGLSLVVLAIEFYLISRWF